MFPDEDEASGAEPAARLRARWDELLDATGTGARSLVAGAAVVGLVLGALWWLTRQAPPPVESTLPLVEVTAPVATTSTTSGPVVVHVAGAVIVPGVHQLPAGSRVIDSVQASGGLSPDADAGAVNLAAELVDGSQVYVPRIGEVPAGPAPGAPVSQDAAGPVDLNAADVALLETLPGVGPATAAAIVDHRERHGPFTSVEGLLEVRGIGEAKLEALRDLVRV
jgi:competence protein ComEA